MKNWEPFVLGPAFAIDRRNGAECFLINGSSANLGPKIDSAGKNGHASKCAKKTDH